MGIQFRFNPFTGKLDQVSVEDLSGYVPYTGATTNVDLGVRNFTTGGSAYFANGNAIINADGTFVVNSLGLYSSFFAGTGAGDSATYASISNFFGPSAGYGATYASTSNFFGPSAGYGAINAFSSNFFGPSAGGGATYASASNFFGDSAGYGATYASASNFFGIGAGYGATDASNSNFFGYGAGNNATNAYYSNFIGNSAGDNAINAYYSNFIGDSAGYGAINAYYSNFFGGSAGYGAINAYYSNFFGFSAGYGATDASNSNFFGFSAGYGATNASYSIFLGTNAGNMNNTTDSTFINNLIIDQATLSTNSPRISINDIKNNALLYGVFADTAINQNLTINGYTNINQDLNVYRDLNVGRKILNASGLVGTPTYAFTDSPNTGFWETGTGTSSRIEVAVNGVNQGHFLNTGWEMESAQSISWNNRGGIAYDSTSTMRFNAAAGNFTRIVLGKNNGTGYSLEFDNTNNIMTLGNGLGVTTLRTFRTGGFMGGYIAKTADYTLTVADYTVNCTANSFTITLPTAVGFTGQIYNVKNSGSGVITINTTSSQTIDGVASGATTLAQYENLTVQSDGANWMIL